MMQIKFRKITHLLIYYLTPVFLLILATQIKSLEFFKLLGQSALYLLGVILFVKPLAAIFKLKIFWKIVSYRRELGVLNFWLFFFHFAGMNYMYQFYKPEYWGSLGTPIYWGLVAGLGMTILTLTANNYAIKKLKKNWKKLHYSAYFVMFAAFVHVALTKQEVVKYALIFALFVILKVIEFRKIKKPTN
ncbi:MAG: hypothetical protein A2725_00865 [Candidatus Magasanikbacteria bacterium RIFCSPHIGHO2_01_FULL_33_34]|uniref:Ferric oxidoreductase domain-containing protein n=1 Tax=Candidatus Magasanikbacteria bacterium RIFCSPHIGHO2_01_FULL_33_34 TaxID=1798671 RepID=A0A1F6LJ94_9BACT|nr:MAG: hypothetical protein A2725_00865 [Candidatus Magasanikbacteria bacterium RIFCSPHIGHO2_01_FULL_33_34]OGH65308.1 MAG: hypothetical protein A3B83_04525 [Candidatus Magasanikbacteria bacterium RIFCSPHIGHO2_02_FULL_33_17]OGH81744.1 MAG: hypothetical protein A3F93_00710 [Candidatus Magasanikbacteria bacterium RIFCSPLOWO2_12_FULL_34_7]